MARHIFAEDRLLEQRHLNTEFLMLAAMSSNGSKQQLHWTQRVALVRHNLHAASRSGDFTFFKTLQAMGLVEGTNHVAILSAALGDDADIVLSAMDNLNAGLAYVYQDAFKKVYDNLKESLRDGNEDAVESKLYVDITMQKNMADMAIDKMSSSAIALINQQPAHTQDTVASVWVTGVTIVADAMAIVLQHMETIDIRMDDFIRLEESWNTVKAAVVCAITGLKGVFFLMDTSSPPTPGNASQRSASIASASGAVFRRLSNAFTTAPASGVTGPSPTNSRNASTASNFSNFANFARNASVSSISSNPVYRTPNYVRNSVSTGCPTWMPAAGDVGYQGFQGHKLSMIPPTPAQEELLDPFDTSAPPVPQLPDLAMMKPTVSGGLAQRRLSQTTVV